VRGPTGTRVVGDPFNVFHSGAQLRLMLRLLLLCSFSLANVVGQEKNPKNPPQAPMPAKILSAKTVFLSVQTDMSEFHLKHAYGELRKWDRWKVVADPHEADLYLVLVSRTDAVGTYTAVSVSSSRLTGISIPITASNYTLFVFDATNKQLLWSAAAGESFFLKSRDATNLIKKLRKRIQETEAKNLN
jgi:hypothetical protein